MKNTVFAVSLLAGIVAIILYSFSSPDGNAANEPIQAAGVTIYAKSDFNEGKDAFSGSKQVQQTLVEDAISGQALKTVCLEKWAGPALGFSVQGSTDLKMAFMAKGEGYKRAALNVFDKKANDNTTPYGYRRLPDNKWRPIVYYLERFRYNSKRGGTVRKNTDYNGVRFFGPKPSGSEISLSLDNFVLYRGNDRQAPEKVTGLKAGLDKKGVNLRWAEAKDNTFPMVYAVARATKGGEYKKIAETYKTKYVDKYIEKGKFEYKVLACDFENNCGNWSEKVQIDSDKDFWQRDFSKEESDRLDYARHVREVHKQGNNSVNKGKVLLYGDSLTKASVYREKVAAELGIYEVDARGYPGKRTGWGRVNALEKALKPMNPEVIGILFGTNNVRGKMHSQSTLKTWIDDLEAIVKAAEKRGTVPILGTIPPRGFNDPKSEPEALYNELLIKRARELQVPVAYIFSEIQESGDRRKYIWKDGVHWTSKGMQAAAKAWGRSMREVGFALRQ